MKADTITSDWKQFMDFMEVCEEEASLKFSEIWLTSLLKELIMIITKYTTKDNTFLFSKHLLFQLDCSRFFLRIWRR